MSRWWWGIGTSRCWSCRDTARASSGHWTFTPKNLCLSPAATTAPSGQCRDTLTGSCPVQPQAATGSGGWWREGGFAVWQFLPRLQHLLTVCRDTSETNYIWTHTVSWTRVIKTKAGKTKKDADMFVCSPHFLLWVFLLFNCYASQAFSILAWRICSLQW